MTKREIAKISHLSIEDFDLDFFIHETPNNSTKNDKNVRKFQMSKSKSRVNKQTLKTVEINL